MPIDFALQLAYCLAQRRAGADDGGHGSNEILGSHVLAILRREQVALRSAHGLHDLSQSLRGVSPEGVHQGLRHA